LSWNSTIVGTPRSFAQGAKPDRWRTPFFPLHEAGADASDNAFSPVEAEVQR